MNKRRILVLEIGADLAGRRGPALVEGLVIKVFGPVSAKKC